MKSLKEDLFYHPFPVVYFAESSRIYPHIFQSLVQSFLISLHHTLTKKVDHEEHT